MTPKQRAAEALAEGSRVASQHQISIAHRWRKLAVLYEEALRAIASEKEEA